MGGVRVPKTVSYWANENNRGKAIVDVQVETERQEDLWGVQNHQDGYWLGILVEEVGEAAKETLVTDPSVWTPDRLEEEVIHVAAVCVSWLMAIRRRKADNE